MLKGIIGSQNNFKELKLTQPDSIIRKKIENLLRKQSESSVIILYRDEDVDIETVKKLLLTGDRIKI